MRTLALIFLLTLTLVAASCKRPGVSEDKNQNSANAPAASGAASSVPPFATKEPERYQATRVVTSGADAGGGEESRTLIARDGDRRREEYAQGAGGRVAYLQLPEGSYVLLPAKKLYAELKAGSGGDGGAHGARVPPDFSPEKLLNEARPETLYERLGEESLNGRATTKYRVTVRGQENGAVASESFVWVDEGLGMPVRTETTSPGARITMELRDIKETVDAGLLELPADYRRVAPAELFAEAR
ncbi:MAG TPA: hypothetical protein VN256_19485 [Pyrinomonadaceae bacterium]|nr:hypothetical protein [Pyrinomonadaceae bacterium]